MTSVVYELFAIVLALGSATYNLSRIANALEERNRKDQT